MDDLRITFDNDEVVHLRPSGNAPEFGCHTESSSSEKAASLCRTMMVVLINGVK